MFEPFPEARRVAQVGRELTIPVDVSLPLTRCLFCAGRDHALAWKASHASPFFQRGGVRISIGFMVMFLLCPFIILMVFPLALFTYFTSRPTRWLTLPRCGPCADRSTTARVVGTTATFLLGVGVPAGGAALGHWSGGADQVWLGVLLGVPLAGVATTAVRRLWIDPRMIRCVEVEERTVTLIVPNAEATAEALAEMANS